MPWPTDRPPNRFAALSVDVNPIKKKKTNDNLSDFPHLPHKLTSTINPKFILISSADKNVSLSQLSPFAIKKSIEAISTEVDSISQIRDGNLLILTRSARVAEKFLKTKAFPNLCPINVKLHDNLNSVKGVIYAPCLKHVAEDEIVSEMKNQNVTGVYKFSRQIEGKSIFTGLMVLTFDLYRLPESVDVAWYKVKVQPYIPNPIRCKNCQRLGHTLKRCQANPACNTCNLPPHNPEKCTRTLCANCANEHPSSDRNCPKYVQAKEVLRILTLEKCSIGEARRKYKERLPFNQQANTYAHTVKNTATSQSETSLNKSNRTATTTTSSHTNSSSSTNSYSINPSTHTNAIGNLKTDNILNKPISTSSPILNTTITATTSSHNSTTTDTTDSILNLSAYKSPISLYTQKLLKNNDYYVNPNSPDYAMNSSQEEL